MDTSQYDWVDFYKEFSHLLLAYKNNRQELIDKVRSILATLVLICRPWRKIIRLLI